MSDGLLLRRFVDEDAEALTELLHAAYRDLTDRGLNFTAATQDVETTRSRAAEGACWVIEHDGMLSASLTMSFPPPRDVQQLTPVARVHGRAWIGQIAVLRSLRGRNVARRLYENACEWARANGVTSVGLDTALPAPHLASMYERWGFTRMGFVHFEDKAYDSVVMVHELLPSVTGGEFR